MKGMVALFPSHPMFRKSIRKAELSTAMKPTAIADRLRWSQRLRYHHVSDVVLVALTGFICAAAATVANPLPPGVGAGSGTGSTAGGSRKSLQIDPDRPSGCIGVIAERCTFPRRRE
jgi:hypothetical protein